MLIGLRASGPIYDANTRKCMPTKDGLHKNARARVACFDEALFCARLLTHTNAHQTPTPHTGFLRRCRRRERKFQTSYLNINHGRSNARACARLLTCARRGAAISARVVVRPCSGHMAPIFVMNIVCVCVRVH